MLLGKRTCGRRRASEITVGNQIGWTAVVSLDLLQAAQTCSPASPELLQTLTTRLRTETTAMKFGAVIKDALCRCGRVRSCVS
mgnify:FL=1